MLKELLDIIVNEEDLAKIGAELEQFKRDSQFLDANRVQWRAAYPDKWVVVFQEELVGVGDTVQDALLRARVSDADKSRVAIEYLASKPVKMILLEKNT